MADAFDEAWDQQGSSNDSFDSVWDATPSRDEMFADASKQAASKISGNYDSTMGNLKGIAQGALDVVALPADLMARGGNYIGNLLSGNHTTMDGVYPTDWVSKFLNFASGDTGNQQNQQTARFLTNVAETPFIPSGVGAIDKASKAAQLSRAATLAAKTVGYGAEGAAYGALGNTHSDDLLGEMEKGAVINTALPAGLQLFSKGAGLVPKAFSSIGEMFSPQAKALSKVEEIANAVRGVSPGFATEALSPTDRMLAVNQGLQESAGTAKKAAGQLFENLPNEPVALDEAIANTKNFATQKGSLLTPGTAASNIVNALENLQPKAATTLLDETGKAVANPTTLGLPALQDALRDVGKVGERTTGVDSLIASKAKSELLDAAKNSVSPEAFNALQEARQGWSSYVNTYKKGAVGKAIKSLEDPNASGDKLQKLIFSDSKYAKQLGSVMKPEELAHTEQIMLSDLVKRSPATWGKRMSEKQESFKAIFGPERTQKLMDMVSQDGTVGKKLLNDHQGKLALFGKIALKTGLGAALGDVVGGEKGALAGAAYGLGSSSAKAIAQTRVQSLLMRAAAGDSKILELLSQSASKGNYSQIISKVADRLSPLIGKAAIAATDNNNITNDLFSKPQMSQAIKPPEVISTKRTAKESSYSDTAEELADSVIAQESSGKANAVSKVGAQGLMQLMPATGRELFKKAKLEGEYKPFDPAQNRLLGTMYLEQLLKEFNGDKALALTAYNQGPARVKELLRGHDASSLEEIIPHLGPDGKKYAKQVLSRLGIEEA